MTSKRSVRHPAPGSVSGTGRPGLQSQPGPFTVFAYLLPKSCSSLLLCCATLRREVNLEGSNLRKATAVNKSDNSLSNKSPRNDTPSTMESASEAMERLQSGGVHTIVHWKYSYWDLYVCAAEQQYTSTRRFLLKSTKNRLQEKLSNHHKALSASLTCTLLLSLLCINHHSKSR